MGTAKRWRVAHKPLHPAHPMRAVRIVWPALVLLESTLSISSRVMGLVSCWSNPACIARVCASGPP